VCGRLGIIGYRSGIIRTWQVRIHILIRRWEENIIVGMIEVAMDDWGDTRGEVDSYIIIV
jgi:6,7-dimethyl-8-ribityllumazine synthase